MTSAVSFFPSLMKCATALVATLAIACITTSVHAQKKTYLHTDRIDVVDFDGLQDWIEAQEAPMLVVNFWATWCKPCVDELYFFEELQEQVDAEQIKVVLVSLDFVRGHEDKLPAFLDRHDMTLDVALLDDPASNEWIDRVDTSWSGAIPATWLLSDENTDFHEGAFADLNELLYFVQTFHHNTKP